MPKKKVAESKAKHVRDFENMADAEILQQITSDIRASQAFQNPYFDKFKGYYKQYRSYIDPDKRNNDRSNLFIPYTFHQVETVAPKLVLSMFRTRPYVQTVPLGLNDNELRVQRSKKMNKLLDYQFQQKIKLVPVVTDVVKTTNIYGTAITKQSWDYRTGKAVTRRPSVKVPGATELVLVERVLADDPKITLIPLLDFFFDPAGTTIDECRYCIHRYWEDLHELQKKNEDSQNKYKNLDKIQNLDSGAGAQGSDKMLTQLGLSTSINAQKGVEIWEYWTDDWVVKIANQSTVIYSGMNPYFHMKKPFAKWVDTPVPNEFYGIGIPESIECLQAELNTTRNQRIDNVSLVLNKMWLVKRGANVDTTQLVSRPAGFIEIDEEKDVEELKFTDVTQSAYQEEAIIKGDMDRTTGIHDTERGSTPTRRETATTMNILSSAGNQRFELKTMLAEYGGCHDMINQIMWLNQQYIDRDMELILLGDDGTLDTDTVKPEEIQGKYAIVAVGSSIEPVVNKEMRQTQLVQLYNIVAQRPDVNHSELLKAIFEEFDMKNVDRFFVQLGMNPTGKPDITQLLGGMMNAGQ